MTIRDHHDHPAHPWIDAAAIITLSILAVIYGHPRLPSIIIGAIGGITGAVILYRTGRQ